MIFSHLSINRHNIAETLSVADHLLINYLLIGPWAYIRR